MAFKSFSEHTVKVKSEACGTIEISALVGPQSSTKKTLVLLHGFPQTRYIWHKIAEELAPLYNVLIPDLRGYGRSSKPRGSPNTHVEYSKREMASDIVQVAKHFGHEEFYLCAHDRGARVAHRLCLDYPEAVKRLMILDIIPTVEVFETTDREVATKYWHWFFQLLPMAEEIIGGNPEAVFRQFTRQEDFAPEAKEDYLKHYCNAEGIHGACEDYRAANSIDMEHDRADREAGKKLQVEHLKVFWGSTGLLPWYGDVCQIWRRYSNSNVDVSGRSMESNHYIPENADRDLLQEIKALFPAA